MQGWDIFSGDCFGSLFMWDVRGHSCSCQWSLGLDSINSIAVDPAKTVCACTMDNSTVTLLDLSSSKVLYTSKVLNYSINCHSFLQEWKLEGNHEQVLGVVFTAEADGLVSSAHDGTITVWQ